MVYKWGGEDEHSVLVFYKRDMEGVKNGHEHYAFELRQRYFEVWKRECSEREEGGRVDCLTSEPIAAGADAFHPLPATILASQQPLRSCIVSFCSVGECMSQI
jgi:hypothetical protein